MKHFYCASALIGSYMLIFLSHLHKAPHLLNGRLDDLIGFSFTMWVFIAFPIFMLFYDPQRNQTVRIGG